MAAKSAWSSRTPPRLRGERAVLAGRPDLVVIRDQRIDVKTGEPRPWHYQQMLIYMYALRIALDVPSGVHLTGEIVYAHETVKVGPGAVHQGFVRDLGELIRRLAGDRPTGYRAVRNADSATSARATARSAWTPDGHRMSEKRATSRGQQDLRHAVRTGYEHRTPKAAGRRCG